MKQVLYILFGALFTGAFSLALGRLLLARLRLHLYRAEQWLFAYLLGAASLSLIVFALSACHLFHKNILLLAGAAAIIAAWRTGALRVAAQPAPLPPPFWRWLFRAAFALYALLYLPYAMAPEMSPDGSTYHLGLVSRIFRLHGFQLSLTDFYKNMPAGLEMLFLAAFSFGRHSAAALLHFQFLLLVPLLTASFGRRFGYPAAGIFAGLAFLACPVAAIDGTSAYVDAALAATVFAVFYLIEIWRSSLDPRLLAAAAALAGFAFSIKYTGATILLYAFCAALWTLRRSVPHPLPYALARFSVSLVWILPWTIKSWIAASNPLTPFFGSLFPNPAVHPSFLRDWSALLTHYGITSYWQLPWELCVRGERVSGIIGPLFLLAPIALFALRSPIGRRVLLAAAFAAAPYASNIDPRFLLPALPFLAFALSLVLASIHPLAAALPLLLSLVFSLPALVPLYAYQYTWKLDSQPPWPAALRRVQEGIWLYQHFPGFRADVLLERTVPANEAVFSLFQSAESYTSRDIVVAYQSGPAETLRDAIFSAVTSTYRPSLRLRFSFPSRPLTRLRIVQTAPAPGTQWSISEIRLASRGIEIPPSPAWRARAQPDPWDVRLALDNIPVTRWRTWTPARPGMYFEIDLPAPLTADAVLLTQTGDEPAVRLSLEIPSADGAWTALAASPSLEPAAPPGDLRRQAIAQLKSHGYHWLFASDDNYAAPDLRANPAAWGLIPAGSVDAVRLYRIP